MAPTHRLGARFLANREARRFEPSSAGLDSMTKRLQLSRRRRAAVGSLGLVFTLLAAPVPAGAQGGAPLVGVWGASIQLRDCASGAAIGPPIRALYTYHQDGTLIQSPSATAFQPGQRSVGHGTWSVGAGGTFAERVVALIVFTTPPGTPAGSPGFQAGWEVAAATITMTDPDHYTASGGARFFDTERREYRSACTTRTAERFK